ncbi:MAG TPA: DUF6582 domain-containing protein [Ilumatobacteraceae bacterium]|jgi:hypothetical protein
MSTTKQKQAARQNIKKAQQARAEGSSRSRSSGLSTATRNRMRDSTFAFPDERKEPLNDADHVRNAIARFDQVEDVSDAERDRAWKRIKAAAKKFDVEVEAKDWRELFDGGKARKR